MHLNATHFFVTDLEEIQSGYAKHLYNWQLGDTQVRHNILSTDR